MNNDDFIKYPYQVIPDNALDIYQIAEKYNLSLLDAVKRSRQMKFIGYNDFGQEIFIDREVCPSCGNNEAEEPHTCPYAEDINNDRESLCTCCWECANRCTEDI